MSVSSYEEPTADELLRVPETFERQRWHTDLYAPYSPKTKRRVYAYGRRGRALFLRLEAEPLVRRFNISVREVPLVVGDLVKSIAPAAISLDHENQVSIHTFSDVVEEPMDPAHPLPASPWNGWCQTRGWRLIEWTPAALLGPEIELENWEILLRYLSVPGRAPNRPLEDALRLTLAADIEMTWNRLAKQFPREKPETVHECIAALILERRVHADIAARTVSLLTRLSISPLNAAEPLRA